MKLKDNEAKCKCVPALKRSTFTYFITKIDNFAEEDHRALSLFICLTIIENEQITGSFKLRGAFNKLLSLKESNDEVSLTKGAITASTGNHGAAAVSEGFLLTLL